MIYSQAFPKLRFFTLVNLAFLLTSVSLASVLFIVSRSPSGGLVVASELEENVGMKADIVIPANRLVGAISWFVKNTTAVYSLCPSPAPRRRGAAESLSVL